MRIPRVTARVWAAATLAAGTALAAGLFVGTASSAANSDRKRVVLIFDGSGSMNARMGRSTKIEVARRVVKDAARRWRRSGLEAGLVAYGHRRKNSCADIQTLIPDGPISTRRFARAVDSIDPKGRTPLARALRVAADNMNYRDDNATVILISDGRENCRADPCAVARDLDARGRAFTAHVIGFGVRARDEESLRCIAEETGGRYVNASDAAGLIAALSEVEDDAAGEPGDFEQTLGTAELLLPSLEPGTYRLIIRKAGERASIRETAGKTDALRAPERLAQRGSGLRRFRPEPPRALQTTTVPKRRRARPTEAVVERVKRPQAEIEAPRRVIADHPFKARWTGPNRAGDHILLTESDGNSCLDAVQLISVRAYETDRDGSFMFRAPVKPGRYELVYCSGADQTALTREFLRVMRRSDAPSDEHGSAIKPRTVQFDDSDEIEAFEADPAGAGAGGDDGDRPGAGAKPSFGESQASDSRDEPKDGESDTDLAVRDDDDAISFDDDDGPAASPAARDRRPSFSDEDAADEGNAPSHGKRDRASFEANEDAGDDAADAVEEFAAEAEPQTAKRTDPAEPNFDEPALDDENADEPTGARTAAKSRAPAEPLDGPSFGDEPDASDGSEPAAGASEPEFEDDETAGERAATRTPGTDTADDDAEPSFGAGAQDEEPARFESDDDAADERITRAEGAKPEQPSFGGGADEPDEDDAAGRNRAADSGADEPDGFEFEAAIRRDDDFKSDEGVSVGSAIARNKARFPDDEDDYFKLRGRYAWYKPVTADDVPASAPGTRSGADDADGDDEPSFRPETSTRDDNDDSGSPTGSLIEDERRSVIELGDGEDFEGSVPPRFATDDKSQPGERRFAALPKKRTPDTTAVRPRRSPADSLILQNGLEDSDDDADSLSSGRFSSPAFSDNEPGGEDETAALDDEDETTDVAALPLPHRRIITPQFDRLVAVRAGYTFTATWTGKLRRRGWVALARPRSANGAYLALSRAVANGQVKLRAPSKPGQYELRYLSSDRKQLLARQSLNVTPAAVRLVALEYVDAADELSVWWAGPGHKSDTLTLAPVGARDGQYLARKSVGSGNPLSLRAPSKPGTYEMRYVNGADNKVMFRRKIIVAEPQPSLLGP